MSDSFMDLALSGHVLSDEIETYVELWHNSESEGELYDFLGMSPDEYYLWASDASLLEVILSARHSNRSLRQAVNDNLRLQDRIAARADEAGKLSILQSWIASQPDR